MHLWRFQRKTILLEWKGHVLLGKLRCTVDDIDRFSDDTANFSEENGAIRMRERVLLGKVRCTVDKVDLFGDGTAKFSEENGAISMRGRVLHAKNTWTVDDIDRFGDGTAKFSEENIPTTVKGLVLRGKGYWTVDEDDRFSQGSLEIWVWNDLLGRDSDPRVQFASEKSCLWSQSDRFSRKTSLYRRCTVAVPFAVPWFSSGKTRCTVFLTDR